MENRGSLAGDTAAAPAPSPRAPPRVVFLLLRVPPIRFAVRAHCRGSRSPRLGSLFVCVSCLRPSCLYRVARLLVWVVSVWFARFPRVLPLVAPRGARVVRPCGASFARSLPRCRSLGRSGWLPSRWSARSSRPLALLPRHSGLPLRGCFCPASRVMIVFLPSVPLPRPRFAAVAPLGSRGEPALPRAALGVRPLSPHLGGSAPPLGCPLYLSLRCLAPYGRCAVTRLRFVAPSDDTSSCLRLWLLLACPLRGSAASRCPVGLFVCMRVSLRSPRA